MAACNYTKDYFSFSRLLGVFSVTLRFMLTNCLTAVVWGEGCSSLTQGVLLPVFSVRAVLRAACEAARCSLEPLKVRHFQAGNVEAACCVPNKRSLRRTETPVVASSLKQTSCMHAACTAILLPCPSALPCLLFLEILPSLGCSALKGAGSLVSRASVAFSFPRCQLYWSQYDPRRAG